MANVIDRLFKACRNLPPCNECRGSGHRVIKIGFGYGVERCPDCKGFGFQISRQKPRKDTWSQLPLNGVES